MVWPFLDAEWWTSKNFTSSDCKGPRGGRFVAQDERGLMLNADTRFAPRPNTVDATANPDAAIMNWRRVRPPEISVSSSMDRCPNLRFRRSLVTVPAAMARRTKK